MVLKKLKKRRKVIALVSIILAILLGVSVTLFVFDSTKQVSVVQSEEIDRGQVLEAQYKGDYNLAFRLIDDALLKTNDDKQKASLYQLKASVAYNFQRYDEVYSFSSQSYNLSPSVDSVRMMAESSNLTNNKAEALRCYEIALSLVKSSSDEDLRNKKLFEQKIAELKGQI